MFSIYLFFMDILKEEVFLNQKAQKGWLVYKKIGCFYFFKRHHYNHIHIFIELMDANIPLESIDMFQIIFHQKIRKPQLTALYYFIADSSNITEDISRDNHLLLRYFRVVFQRYLDASNVFVVLCAVIFFGHIVIKATTSNNFDFSNVSLLSFPTLLLIPCMYAIIFPILIKLEKKIEDLEVKTEDFGKSFKIRYIIVIEGVNQTSIHKQLPYLGAWEYRFTKHNSSYYYLWSNANEADIKGDLLLHCPPHTKIHVISPFYLFPMGYVG